MRRLMLWRVLCLLLVATMIATTGATAVMAAPEDPPPAATPAPEPSAEPLLDPSAEPAVDPTAEPAVDPTAEPVVDPTAPAEPSADPTTAPVADSTPAPPLEPAPEPSSEPVTPAEPTSAPAASASPDRIGPLAVGPLVVSGTVTEPGGAPISGVVVTAWYVEEGDLAWEEGSTVTLPDGSYSLSLANPFGGSIVLQYFDPEQQVVGGFYAAGGTVVLAVGAATQIGYVPGAVAGVDAAMLAALHISGTVTGIGTGPLAGIGVTAVDAEGNDVAQTSTGDAGTYRLAVLAGTYTVRFRGFSSWGTGWYSTAGFTYQQAAATPLSVQLADATGVNAVLPVAVHIAGTITDIDGNPLQDRWLVAVDPAESEAGYANTDDTGAYSLVVPPGTYLVQVGGGGGWASGWYSAAGFTYERSAATPIVVATSDVAGIDIAVPPAIRITGIVTNAAGAPLADIEISAVNGAGDYAAWASTEWEDGSYALAVAPGTYRLSVWGNETYAGGWYAAGGIVPVEGQAEEIVVAGSDVSGIDIVLSDALHITGTVTDDTGTGIAGMRVTAYSSTAGMADATGGGRTNAAAGGAHTDDTGGGPTYSATTGPDGSYSLAVGPGTYNVYAYDPDGGWLDGFYGSPVVVTTSDVPGIDIVMGQTRHVSGTVTGAGNGPIAGVSVNLVDGNGEWVGDATTDVDGAYAIGVAPGSYRVRVWSDATWLGGWYSAGGWVADIVGATEVAIADTDVSGIDIVMPLAKHITGTVSRTGGGPIDGVWVEAYTTAGQYVYGAEPGPGGAYALSVGPGTFRVYISDRTGGTRIRGWWTAGAIVTDEMTATPIVVASGDVTGIDFVLPALHHVTGRVTTLAGVGLPGIEVNAYGDSWALATTSATGAYSLALPDGSYTVDAYDNDRAYLPAGYGSPVVVAGSDVAGIDLVMNPAIRINGRVMGGGAGVPYVGVTAFNEAGDWVDSTSTEADGSYWLAVGPGSYRVLADSDADWIGGWHSVSGAWTPLETDATPVTVTAADIDAVDVTMLPARHIMGTVHAPGGSPLSTVQIRARDADGRSSWAWSGSDGTYSLPVGPGTFIVSFWELTDSYVGGHYADGGWTAARELATPIVVDASDISGIDITLPVARHITGTVTALGAPTPDVEVTGYDPAGHEVAWGWTAPDGTYSMTVADGPYKVRFEESYGSYPVGWYTPGGLVADQAQATTVTVAGADRPGIDADLSVDTTAPAVTITSVNGVTFAFLFVTRDPIVSVGGSCGTAATDIATVTVVVDGAPTTPVAAACAAGSWNLTFASPITAIGGHTVGATQADAAGNIGSAPVRTVIRTVPPSTDATLSGLVLSSVTLRPAFAAGTTGYEAFVANAVATTSVTATRNEAGATLAVRVGSGSFTSLTSGVASGALGLVVGANAVEVRVTAADGVTTRSYIATVTRADAATHPVPPSGGSQTVVVPAPDLGSPSITMASAAAGATITVEQVVNPVSSTPFAVGDATLFVEITAPNTSGPYTVCLAGTSPDRLWHVESGTWHDVTNPPPGDYLAGKVCGTTATLSPFAIARWVDSTPPTATAPVATPAIAGMTGASVPVALAWTGADLGGSGVASYELRLATNGGAWTTVATTATPAATRSLAPSATRTYRFGVRALDAAGNPSTWVDGPAFKVLLTQQTASAVKYGGSWSTVKTSKASGGSYRVTKARGATATYTFTGRSVAWVATKGTGFGKAKVYLDGRYVTTVNLRSATAWRQLVFAKTWAKSGKHTLRIVNLATSGHPRASLDAVAVLR